MALEHPNGRHRESRRFTQSRSFGGLTVPSAVLSTQPGDCGAALERVTGIEPAWPAWKAGALPLSYTRMRPDRSLDAVQSVTHRKPRGFCEHGYMTSRESQTLRLPDNRTLGFAVYGDPAGQAVFACHGSLSSRLDIGFADQAARELGLRIIGVDRPGMGLSTYQLNRKLTSFPTDVVQLADHLGAEKFAMYGWSAGGPYALATAAAVPDRVQAVALVGSACPYETLRGMRGLDKTDQAMIFMSRFMPAAMSALLKRTVVKANDAKLFALMKEGQAEADLKYLAQLPPSDAVSFLRESVRQGTKGPIRDYKILGAPWGFDLDRVQAPVDLWIGTEDHSGPEDEQQRLAAAMPHAKLHVMEGEGHISCGPDCIAEILSTLVEEAKL